MNKYLSLLVFLVLVVGGGLTVGFLTQPGEWYAALAKPPFNPPGWVFGPVWSLLYVLIAIAGWRVWRSDPRGLSMKLWVGQLLLNFLWSPTFFGLQRVDLALAVILVLLAFVVAFVAATWRRESIAAWLFVPYLLWVAFATLLNASILWLN